MKCECCKLRPFEIEELEHESRSPYRLCIPCHERLIKKALRPLEYFNLTATHGYSYYLHDDFYDYQTGEALNPEMEMNDIDQFSFPGFSEVKNNLQQLVDFSFVQLDTDDTVIKALQQFDKLEVLNYIDKKNKYNRGINYKAYEVLSKVMGGAAEKWMREEWQNRRENELQIFAEPLIRCLQFDEAFYLLTKKLENADDRFLSQNVGVLNYFKSGKTLDWIETVCTRISNVTNAWGHLAASSQFSWARAEKWLNMGRPLSLIALDALMYCTTKGARLNQSPWMQQLNPQLLDPPESGEIIYKLEQYIISDNTPRTKNTVRGIVINLTGH